MKDHLMVLAGLGIATLVMAWLPSLSKRLKISYPIFLLGIGAILFAVNVPLLWPNPFWPDTWLLYISEIIVIISLMGAGLKIGRDYSWSNWKLPFRLIFVTMPLCMLAVYFLGVHFLALSAPAAVLLAAALAPTDPVLASEVQIRDMEQKENSHHAQFALTAEAGINDGIAFPFVFMAVLLVEAGSWATFDFTSWLLDKFLLKITLGVAIGFVIGRSAGYLFEHLPENWNIRNPHGFIALSLTFTAYGVAELLHGYGFLAVFVCALSIRYAEQAEDDIERKMHHFVEEVERLLLVVWLILFGGSILNGLLSFTNWKGVVFAVLLILIIRPLAGWIGLLGIKQHKMAKFAISFYGIRGIGTFFYLAWAFTQTDLFENKTDLYAIAGVVVLVSIVIHGITAPRVMERLDG